MWPRPDSEVLSLLEHSQKPAIDAHQAFESIRHHWLAHIVHDLRGPLFAARGYTKLLLEARDEGVTVTQERYLTTILENITKLAGLVETIQQAPAPSDLSLERIDLNQLLQSVVNHLQEQNKTLQLGCHFFPGPAFTIGDRAKLMLSVQQLLGAAVDFSRFGGRIELHTRSEDDEFTMRISVLPGGSMSGTNPEFVPPALPDVTIPCQILRLHGGVASADCGHSGVYNVTVRLPLIILESTQAKGK